MQATKPFCERVSPQQLAVGISGGCEIKILGTNLELELRESRGEDYVNVTCAVVTLWTTLPTSLAFVLR